MHSDERGQLLETCVSNKTSDITILKELNPDDAEHRRLVEVAPAVAPHAADRAVGDLHLHNYYEKERESKKQ